MTSESATAGWAGQKTGTTSRFTWHLLGLAAALATCGACHHGSEGNADGGPEGSADGGPEGNADGGPEVTGQAVDGGYEYSDGQITLVVTPWPLAAYDIDPGGVGIINYTLTNTSAYGLDPVWASADWPFFVAGLNQLSVPPYSTVNSVVYFWPRNQTFDGGVTGTLTIGEFVIPLLGTTKEHGICEIVYASGIVEEPCNTPPVCYPPTWGVCSTTQIATYDPPTAYCYYTPDSSQNGKPCGPPIAACFSGSICSGGVCKTGTAMPGAPCDDGDVCTSNDTCNEDGVCVGTPITVCAPPPPAECGPGGTLTIYSMGQCDSADGGCDYPSTVFTCTNGCDGGSCL